MSDAKSSEDAKREILDALEKLDLETLKNLKGKQRVDKETLASSDWTLTFWTVWRR